MIKFSIVITTYNRVHLLKRAVESCLKQTLPCEVIIVDDGSSDDTEEYVTTIRDKVIYLRHTYNQGHSQSVNDGVDLATGKWIKFLDDDDYLTPDCLEILSKAITKFNDNLVICSGQAYQVNSQGKSIKLPQKVTGKLNHIKQEDIHYGMLLDRVRFGTPVQVACQREVFFKSGGWDREFDGNYDDINSWLKIAQYGDALFIDSYLGYRTLWEEACHKQLSVSQRCQMNIVIKRKIYNLIPTQYPEKIPSVDVITAYLTIHWFFVGLKQQKWRESISLLNKNCLSLRAWLLFFRSCLKSLEVG